MRIVNTRLSFRKVIINIVFIVSAMMYENVYATIHWDWEVTNFTPIRLDEPFDFKARLYNLPTSTDALMDIYCCGYSFTSIGPVNIINDYYDFNFDGLPATFSIEPGKSIDFSFGSLLPQQIPPEGIYNISLGITMSQLYTDVIDEFASTGAKFGEKQYQFVVNNGYISLVPEPTILAMMGMGLAGIGFLRRRNQKS